MKTIVIAGGSGFIGQSLENHFSQKGYQIKILTRNPKRENEVYWNAKDLGEWTTELENAETLINLTGKSVDCRYTETNKKLIIDSRVNSTKVLGLAINNCKNPPKVWMNASTATIYEYSLTKENDEETGVYGNDFSMNVAKSWENAFNAVKNPKTRKIAMRISIVLGKDGGAFPTLKRLTKFGLGGKQGNGQQKVSWIHEHDLIKAVVFLMDNKNLSGAFNLCVPKPTDNKTLMKTLRHILKVPFGLNSPTPILKLGAFFLGTEPELVLKSRNVVPKRLLDSGFTFLYQNLKDALSNLTDK